MTNLDDTAAGAPPPETGDEIEHDDTPERAGTLANLGAAIVPVLLGLVGAFGAIQLGLGELTDPGAGLWPLFICVTIVGCSVALLVGGSRFFDAEAFTRRSLRVPAAVLGLSALVVVIPLVGFEIPSAILIFLWLRLFGRESWWLSGVLAVSIVVAFWLLFILAFQIPLPRLF